MAEATQERKLLGVGSTAMLVSVAQAGSTLWFNRKKLSGSY